jgi:hypothetical protein
MSGYRAVTLDAVELEESVTDQALGRLEDRLRFFSQRRLYLLAGCRRLIEAIALNRFAVIL